MLMMHDISMVDPGREIVQGIDQIQKQGGGGYKYALANASLSHDTGASGYKFLVVKMDDHYGEVGR